jgi:hypothetical protein
MFEYLCDPDFIFLWLLIHAWCTHVVPSADCHEFYSSYRLQTLICDSKLSTYLSAMMELIYESALAKLLKYVGRLTSCVFFIKGGAENAMFVIQTKCGFNEFSV